VGVEIEGGRLAFNATKWPVRAEEGELVGRVTSAVWSPRLQRNIGYAMVAAGHTRLGSELEVEVAGEGVRSARVVAKPFLDPDKAIPKREVVALA